ncbi:Yip1 member 6, partial [Rhizopus stolonifer]
QNGEQYDNPFARRNDEPFDFYQDGTIEPDNEPTKQPLLNPFANLSGSIGTVPSTNEPDTTFSYTGEDTLDEPVSVTILRDLKQVGRKLQQVLNPKGDRGVLKEWDLWGPLILCLTLAITLSTSAPSTQSVPIFTGIFVIVWLGAAVVTLNAKLLGGSVAPSSLIAFAWSTYAALGFLSESKAHLANRRVLAVSISALFILSYYRMAGSS